MKETDFTKKLVQTLNQISGCYCKKRHGGKFQSGEPDIFGSFQGKTFLIEVKILNGKLSDLQANQLDLWAQKGLASSLIVVVIEKSNSKLLTSPPSDTWFELSRRADQLIAQCPGIDLCDLNVARWEAALMESIN